MSGIGQQARKLQEEGQEVEFLESQDLPGLAKNWWPSSRLGQTGPAHNKAHQKLIPHVGQQHECSRNVRLRFNATIRRTINFPAEKSFGSPDPLIPIRKWHATSRGSPHKGYPHAAASET